MPGSRAKANRHVEASIFRGIYVILEDDYDSSRFDNSVEKNFLDSKFSSFRYQHFQH